jgi:hypothetical protein
MVVVAIVAMVFGAAVAGWRLKQRREWFQSQAVMHSKVSVLVRDEELSSRRMIAIMENELELDRRWFFGIGPERESHRREAEGYRAAAARAATRAAYHDAMRAKYERAVSRPWISVEPDPIEPAWP